ncbi:hypothetical protein BSL82_04660 [Tardibacter chloracetimidivorans]|uniref:Enoyl reductase (ER) domain-containing protein n=1 Tax=Tardibacter chloracetimidivorans TaxID=1921510 RepID=A0A1L3ZSS9_9SPHN|nr:NAD(P)-dependent alcohol dehydrogenase [Tardibacter chloracetimidivorans]API58691.1 hypothetical protein BSL82_04660 [Tardibacter chloracetimidivorans]
MTQAHGYAALEQGGTLKPFAFARREPGLQDIVVDIRYCGVCHTDLNAVRNILGYYAFPLVPRHEIVGKVVHIGDGVTRFQPGDWAGIGTVIDSCGSCDHCRDGLEPYCRKGATSTYGRPDRHGQMAYGGYADNYVIDERYAFRIPSGLDPASAAPLLCAGITTYSPLRRAGIGARHKVGIVGLGGLGHIAVKWAKMFGAHVTVLTTSADKAADAKRLGANDATVSTDLEAMTALNGTLDFILDTVAASHDLNDYLKLLKLGGELCLVGIPAEQPEISPLLLAAGRRSVSGSMTGGLAETEEMLELAARHRIACDVEIIAMSQINAAFERLGRGDVHYRFVIDMACDI